MIINATLLTVFLVLLVIPTLTGEFLVVSPKTFGIVAGLKTVSSSDFSVYPNFSDFNNYVRFSPLDIEAGVYKDLPRVTVFCGQLAIYHKLYSVFNNTDRPLYFKVKIGEVFENSDFSSLYIFWEGEDENWSSIWIENEQLINAETSRLTLNPHSSTVINLRVGGLSECLNQEEQITFPLSIFASFTPSF